MNGLGTLLQPPDRIDMQLILPVELGEALKEVHTAGEEFIQEHVEKRNKSVWNGLGTLLQPPDSVDMRLVQRVDRGKALQEVHTAGDVLSLARVAEQP
jgi:hypothetical protein